MTGAPTIPGITIEGELGRGAHSIVYRAWQGSVPCALKVPCTRARWTRWVYREAVSLARVRHPALPAVFEVGEVDGLPYLVMELVAGEMLAARLDLGPVGEGTAIKIATELAGALEAVHDAGLVHRDVKPRNILVEHGTGALKLVDFGFATPIERAGADDAAGTLAYSAPEQLTPSKHVDGRADLYAVGRVLVECLLGRRGFASIREPEVGYEQVRTLLLANGIDRKIAEVATGLLRHSPEDRYPDARALLSDLALVANGAAPLGPTGYRHGRKLPRLIGRDSELERILRPCRDTSSGGSVVVVRGGRGTGKSRLLDTAEMESRTVARTLRATCRENDPPLSTLRRVIERFGAEAGRPELQARVGKFAPLAKMIAPRAGLGPAPDGVGVGGADALAEGAAEIFLRLARQGDPLVIMIDDAQWMDPVSADALARVAHRVGEAPLVLVIAGRPETSSRRLETFSSVRRLESIELPRLSEAQVGALIASHLGETDVDAALVRRVHSMADATPLGVLEVVGAFLDAGALRPNARSWLFDPAMTGRVVLPRGALVLLGRRLAELPPATHRVLESAAVIGATFGDEMLASVLEMDLEDLAYALSASRRAGLIEPDEPGYHHFVHDSLREMLVDELSDGERRELHQRVGEVLDAEPYASFEDLCKKALHFANGVLERNPRRSFSVAKAAADAAMERFDNETALRFLEDARAAAKVGSISLDAEFYEKVGEALLRLGSLDESLAAFEAALGCAEDTLTRASLLGRLAWVHQTRAEPERAWATLDRAFSVLDARMPVESLSSVATATAQLARAKLGALFEKRVSNGDDDGAEPHVSRSLVVPHSSSARIEVLCELHYQNARLGLEYGKPVRLIESSLESLALSRQGGSARARARALALYGFVLTALRRRDAGGRALATAKEIATRRADAVTVAFCAQVQSVGACWAGDLDHALVLLRECVDIHGPWLEPNELCLDVGNGDLIQSMRGRAEDAWKWIERAVERLRRTPTPSILSDFLIHRARAALVTVGRDAGDDRWLAAQMAAVSPRDPGRGYHRILSWGPRVRYYVETGDVGAEFEELVEAFEREGHDPRYVHLIVCEYYVAVAHGRMQQCLRSSTATRATAIGKLRRAVADLAAISKIPLLRAHRLLAEACLTWFEGKLEKAQENLTVAEKLANEQSCPWVLYGVARIRAHILRSIGRADAARDQARVAEALAREHGAVHRARWVQEEFDLGSPPVLVHDATISRSSSSRTTRQLTALLQVARAPRRELKTEQQAAAILDELIGLLNAERGAIWFQPEATTPPTMIARYRDNDLSLSFSTDSWRARLLRTVHSRGVAWPDTEGSDSDLEAHVNARRVLAVPLYLYEKPVGALCVERDPDSKAFGADARSLLGLLSHQVPITLEIARLLFEREQLQTSLQHAKKMEAMGQLAGGLAHDFNNMLAAMKVALSAARERAALDAELTIELDIISQATTRAAQLTSQLLSFSRHQPVPAGVHDVNQLISTLEPMLRRVVGSKVSVVTNLSPAVDAVEVDQGSFDQALVNLLINARDAMPGGGRLTVTTRNVVLSEPEAQRKNIAPGAWVEVEVADTGEGMSPETLSRIFEPFFTTKPAGSGSGLGLAMVYAFARNCGGSIDVSSEVGQGTQFRLYLKRVDRVRASRPVRAVSSAPIIKHEGPDTILVVDDDDLVRRSIAKILERNGYRVIAASGSVEALNLAREQGARIGLVILDVLMPGVTGPELGRRLYDLNLSAKLLFVSGFSPESIPLEDAHLASEMLLQKPFSQTALLERVRQLMHH